MTVNTLFYGIMQTNGALQSLQKWSGNSDSVVLQHMVQLKFGVN